MNDFELKLRLKNVPVPERPEDYWENFPAQVGRKLRRRAVECTPRNPWLPRFAWSGGFATVIALGIWLGQSQPLKAASYALFKDERQFRMELAQFPSHLRVFMQDEHGMHYLVAEQE